jgi:hypothetical protein
MSKMMEHGDNGAVAECKLPTLSVTEEEPNTQNLSPRNPSSPSSSSRPSILLFCSFWMLSLVYPIRVLARSRQILQHHRLGHAAAAAARACAVGVVVARGR